MLRLYRKSVEEPLTSAELLKVEEVRRRYPWFALPSFILAKNRLQSGVKSEIVQAAAALAPNRSMLREYLTGVPESWPEWQEETISNNLNNQFIQTDLSGSEPVIEIFSIPAIEEAPTAPEPILAEVPEPTPEPPPPLEVTPTPIAEKPVEPVTAPVQPELAKPPAPQPAAGIDWGLNTRIEIRSKQYLKLLPKLEAQMAKYKAAFAEPVLETTAPLVAQPAIAEVITSPPPVQVDEPVLSPQVEETIPSVVVPLPPQAEVAAPAVLEGPDELPSELAVLDEPVAEIPLEVQPAAETEIPAVPEISSAPESLSPLEKTQKLLDSLAGIEKRNLEVPEVSWELESVVDAPYDFEEVEEPSLPDEETAGKETVYEAEYKIGAFSGFAFLGSSEPAEEPAAEAPQPEVSTSGTEIVLNEEADGRIVEITVSEEQLKKYFKGKMPANTAITPPKPEKKTPTEKKSPEVKDFKLKPGLSQEARLDRREYVSSLIEKFIENEPSIGSVKSHKVSGDNLARPSLEEDDSLVTETLASIHLKQGNPAKAIKIYQKLALQLPEKKDYFVALISKIKGL